MPRVKDSVPLSGRVLCLSVFREGRRRDEVEFWVKNRDDGPESNTGWGGITIERRAHEYPSEEEMHFSLTCSHDPWILSSADL